MDIIIAITILFICYFSGKAIEKSHYKSIKQREILLIKKPYLSFEKKLLNNKEIQEIQLVASSVVIGCDRFRSFLADLRNIFGGNVSTYESLMDRGRREALLRIREKAYNLGANIVINVKIDSVMLDPIDARKKTAPKVCVTAYGTAVKYARK